MRKFFCLLFLFVAVFFSLPVYADSVVSNQDLVFRCSNCSYRSAVGSFAWVNDTADMVCPECGGQLGIFQGSTFISGGGVTRGGGAGRDVTGFSGVGVPNYSSAGILQLVVDPYGFTGAPLDFSSSPPSSVVLGSSGSGLSYPYSKYFYPVYSFVAPCDGLYFFGFSGSPYTCGTFNFFDNSTWLGDTLTRTYPESSYYGDSVSLAAGSECYFSFSQYSSSYLTSKSYKYSLNPIAIFCEPLGGSSVTNNTSITINNNTFNGNIYVDGDTNITYIPSGYCL